MKPLWYGVNSVDFVKSMLTKFVTKSLSTPNKQANDNKEAEWDHFECVTIVLEERLDIVLQQPGEDVQP